MPDLSAPDPVSGVVFVFGSNDTGRHGKGAALVARNLYGAKQGFGRGRTGNAYGIPTKDARIRSVDFATLVANVRQFANDAHAGAQQETGEWFLVTRVGCSLAGFTDEQVAPIFTSIAANCILPRRWENIYRQNPALKDWLQGRKWHDRDAPVTGA